MKRLREARTGMVRILSKPSMERFTAAFVALLSVASLVYAIIIGNRTADLSACQLAYSTGFADALDARSDAAQATADAQDELWRTVQRLLKAQPGATARAEFETQLNTYLDARARAKTAQVEHPITTPRNLCRQ